MEGCIPFSVQRLYGDLWLLNVAEFIGLFCHMLGGNSQQWLWNGTCVFTKAAGLPSPKMRLQPLYRSSAAAREGERGLKYLSVWSVLKMWFISRVTSFLTECSRSEIRTYLQFLFSVVCWWETVNTVLIQTRSCHMSPTYLCPQPSLTAYVVVQVWAMLQHLHLPLSTPQN